ncbi:MAG: DUF1735 domain-containing protein [Bacteroidales bacterium]|nr:DUF1735 domain-containing protein [Bacteroidales bacterium]
MRIKNLILSMSAGALALGMSSCENGDISFPDYDGGISVYFPYQYPIRTITLGEIATYDNSRESNEHKFTIYSTMGGSYSGKDINVDFKVDESLLEGLTFDGINPVKALPSDYYTLSGNTLSYNGTFQGGVDVQLNDAFFNDPASAKTTYVIPLLMTSVSGADAHILSEGIPIPEKEGQNPLRTDVNSWNKSPMDFTLYCVNFINKFDGNYLRRGTDEISNFGRKAVSENAHAVAICGNQKEWSWDNQFWIMSDVPFETGKEWSLKMKVKADLPATRGSQTHRGLGGYIHWAAVGNVDFTTEWTEFTASGSFSTEQNGGDCIAFNLGTGDPNHNNPEQAAAVDDANTYYFDEIELIVDGKVACKLGEAGGWAIKSNIGDNANEMIDHQYWEYDGSKIIDGSTVTRQKDYIESDEVIKVSTKTLNSVTLPVKVSHADGTPVTCTLLLTFDGDNCTISVDPDSESAALGFTATGTGEFKSKSEKLAWGNKDRDGLYLNYTIDLGDCKYSSQDVLVARDRGTAGSVQTFKPVYTQQ